MAESKGPVVRGQQQTQSIQPQQQQQGQVIRSPFSLMRRMMEDMDRLFDEVAGGRSSFDVGDYGAMTQLFNPQIEVLQRDGNLVVRADLPGLSKEDVRVHAMGDELVIEGERKSEEKKNEGGVYHSERSYGSFERRIPLPRGVDVSKCDASFENGVLEIELPLPQESKRAIEIKGAAKQQQAAPQPKPAAVPQNGPASRPH
ncbi:MAG TPA: Hsp20/alpha crystallin family protein [Labilithrix sp.]